MILAGIWRLWEYGNLGGFMNKGSLERKLEDWVEKNLDDEEGRGERLMYGGGEEIEEFGGL